MISRPELIKPPFCPGIKISHEVSETGTGQKEHFFILPSGEKLVLMQGEDSREMGRVPTRLSPALQEAIWERYRDLRQENQPGWWNLKDQFFGVLHYQFGFGRREAFSWAQKTMSCDPVVDRIFPHWLFISLLNRACFGMLYGLGKPKIVTTRPSLEDLRAGGLDRKDVEEFEYQTPPILAGTAVPLLGNFGSTVGIGTRPKYTMLRQRTGKIASGQLSFPGGMSDSLLELTAWEELNEEMPSLQVWGRSRSDTSITTLFRGADFLAVADHIFLDEKGSLHRFLNYVFAFWLAFPYSGGGPQAFISIEKYLDQIRGSDGDLGGEWIPAQFTQETMELVDPAVRDNLSPIAEIAMDVVKGRWGQQ
jgi:hypothetical protein